MQRNRTPKRAANTQARKVGQLMDRKGAAPHPRRSVELNAGVESRELSSPGKPSGEHRQSRHSKLPPDRHQSKRGCEHQGSRAQQSFNPQPPLQVRQERSSDDRTRAEKSEERAISSSATSQVLAGVERNQRPQGTRGRSSSAREESPPCQSGSHARQKSRERSRGGQ